MARYRNKSMSFGFLRPGILPIHITLSSWLHSVRGRLKLKRKMGQKVDFRLHQGFVPQWQDQVRCCDDWKSRCVQGGDH